MEIKKFIEIINTILTAKLTDFCGDYAYEILPQIGTEYFNHKNIRNYTFRDYIKMFPKIIPLYEPIKEKTLANYSFKHKVYLDVLHFILLYPVDESTYFSVNEVFTVGSKKICKRKNDKNFGWMLRSNIYWLMNKLTIHEFFSKTLSLYAKNINQLLLLGSGYSVLRGFDILLTEEIFEVDYITACDMCNCNILDYNIGGMLYYFCIDKSNFTLLDFLLFTPFSVAAGLTIPFLI